MYPNHISISLSASSSFTFSRILLIQGYLCWSRLAYLSQESSQRLSPNFPTVFQHPIKYKSIFPEITPLFVWRYSTLHSVPLSYPCQPFTLTDNHPICTAFYMVTDLTPTSTSFQPPTHTGPSENSLLCSTPHLWHQVCEVADEVDLSTLSTGTWEMKSLPLHVSGNWHLRRGLSTLQQGLNDNATDVKYLVPSNQSPFGTILLLLWTLNWQARGPSRPRGKPQDLPM